MKLSAPFKGATKGNVSQGYSLSHPALDMYHTTKPYGYGTPLTAPEDVLVLQTSIELLTHDNQGLTKGYGIFMKGLETGQTHLYWHTLPVFPVRTGDTIKRGKIVAYMGNAGTVFANGSYVPVEDRLRSKLGTHLHWEVYNSEYRLGGRKRFVNFTSQVDWQLQPTYTPSEQIKSTLAVVAKITKLIK